MPWLELTNRAPRLLPVEFGVEVVQAEFDRRPISREPLLDPGLVQPCRPDRGFDVGRGLEVADQIPAHSLSVVIKTVGEQRRAAPAERPLGIYLECQIKIVEVARPLAIPPRALCQTSNV